MMEGKIKELVVDKRKILKNINEKQPNNHNYTFTSGRLRTHSE